MKNNQKDPKGNVKPEVPKKADQPGQGDHLSPGGKSASADPERTNRGNELIKGSDEYGANPEESAHMKDQALDTNNSKGHTYKRDEFIKGHQSSPDDEDDFEENIREEGSLDDDDEF